MCEATTGRAAIDENVVDRGRRSVRDVHDDPERLHPGQELPPGRGQAALQQPVGGAAEAVSKKWARRDHPVARGGEDIDVVDVVVERMGALDREERGGDRRVGRAPSQVGAQVGA